MSISIRNKSIGLALGGGGARGLVHVEVLRILDEYGLKPKVISGASIGAIIGALYCSGNSGSDIRKYTDKHLRISGEIQNWRDNSRNMMEMVKLLDIDFSGTGIIKGDRFSHFLYEMLEGENFSDLEIPLRIVATDFWNSETVVYETGSVLSAVKASMSVPGVFAPAQYEGRVLIDGACSNPVPCDLLDDCDVLIGVNALGRATPSKNFRPPRAARAVLETFDIMQRGILAEKYRYSPPDFLLDPPIQGVGLLDFHKATSIYEQSATELARFREFLDSNL